MQQKLFFFIAESHEKVFLEILKTEFTQKISSTIKIMNKKKFSSRYIIYNYL